MSIIYGPRLKFGISLLYSHHQSQCQHGTATNIYFTPILLYTHKMLNGILL